MSYLPRKQPIRGYHPPSPRRISKQQKVDKKAAKRFYNKAQWIKLSKLERSDNPVCCVCESSPSAVCDHVIRIDVDVTGIAKTTGGAPFDRRNHMAMCHKCHNVKRGLELSNFEVAKVRTPSGFLPKRRADIIDKIRQKRGLDLSV